MRTTKIGPDLRLQRHRTKTRRSLIEHRSETFGREGLIWWIKSQSSLLKIYFHLFTSATDRIHFTRALHRSFAQNLSAVCDASLSRWVRAASLRYRNRAEIIVLMCKQKTYTVWFSCRRESYPAVQTKPYSPFLVKPKTQGSNESRVYWTTNKIYICRSNDSPNNCTVFLWYYYQTKVANKPS